LARGDAGLPSRSLSWRHNQGSPREGTERRQGYAGAHVTQRTAADVRVDGRKSPTRRHRRTCIIGAGGPADHRTGWRRQNTIVGSGNRRSRRPASCDHAT
jgi:hypothetical protein